MTLRVSVKQIKMVGPATKLPGALGGCARQWVAYYLDKLQPEFKAQALVDGIAFHKACAELVEFGELRTVTPESFFGKMARAGYGIMPRGDWLAETVSKFPWTTQAGTECTIDLRCDLRGVGRFGDWKSTSARKWALKSLDDEIQARVYAHGVMLEDDTDTADASWIYVCKRDLSAWIVPGIFHRESNEKWLHREIDRSIDLIAILRELAPTFTQLPRELDACESVGKFCDVAGHCFKNDGEHLISAEELLRYRRGTE